MLEYTQSTLRFCWVQNNPIIVTVMKEACDHNLYVVADSAGMNGAGADTMVKPTGLLIVGRALHFLVFVKYFVLFGRKIVEMRGVKRYNKNMD